MKTHRLNMVAMTLIALAACSSQSETTAPTPVSKSIQTSPTQNTTQLTTKLNKAESADTQQQGFAYRVRGTEPFWGVDVNADNTLVFSTPDNIEGTLFKAERSAYAKGVEYTGTHEGKEFHLNLNGKSCSDMMSDQTYDMIATFKYQGIIYKGCAIVQ